MNETYVGETKLKFSLSSALNAVSVVKLSQSPLL